jgi:hypothetical protein
VVPHAVDGIGDEAFITEKAAPDDALPHRDATLVFRKANVVVTVEYQEWPQRDSTLPSSDELQTAARMAAKDLAERLSEQ